MQKNLHLRVLVLAFVALAGVAMVKWIPYYGKALIAQQHHTLGSSILTGKSATIPAPSWHAALDYAAVYIKAIWQALVLGLLLGSGIKALLPQAWMGKALGKMGFRNIAIGGLAGVPSMMCTCCAAPVAVGMRKNSASVGGVVAWWISNPVLNPATLVFMGFVLGWKWSFFRAALGILMVLGIALLAERVGEKTVSNEQVAPLEVENGSFISRWIREFVSLSIGLVPEYFAIVFLLGAARAWLFPVLGVHHGILWIAAMSLAGTLFVIPTAGEIPIVQGMLALGLGAGPAAALIMTLPAVSLPSLAMLGRVIDLKTRLFIGAGVAVSGIAAGMIAAAFF